MLELENPKYEKEEIVTMEIGGGYTKIPAGVSYVINPNEAELTELVKATEFFQKSDETKKQAILDDVKTLYSNKDYDSELDTEYAVTAVGYKDELIIYVGGSRVNDSYDISELIKQHNRVYKNLWYNHHKKSCLLLLAESI